MTLEQPRLDLESEASYRAFFGGLRRFFTARGVPPEEAADLAQETLTRSFVHIKRHGMTGEDPWPLLRTVARNLYSDRGRRAAPPTVELTAADSIADPSMSPDELAIESERRAAVRTAVRSLPARHRRVLELALVGLGPAEIARELGVKRNAADALLHRARRNLASKLDLSRAGLGIFVPVLLRVRVAMRRLASTAARLDPTGGAAAAATSVAAVTLVVILGVGSPFGQGRAATASSAPTAQIAGVVLPEADGRDLGNSRNAAPARNPVREETRIILADLQDQRISGRVKAQNPTNPDDDEIGVDIWRVREPHRRGPTSPVWNAVDTLGANVCDNRATSCTAGTP